MPRFWPWLLGFHLAVGLGIFHSQLRWPASLLEEPGSTVSTTSSDEASSGEERAGEHDESVLVIEVESRDLLERLREQLDRRMLLSERDVIAVENCVFAYDLEKVGGALEKLGWVSRSLDLVGRQRGPGPPLATSSSAPSASNLIADLASKPSLTRNEAMALLEQMDSVPGYAQP